MHSTHKTHIDIRNPARTSAHWLTAGLIVVALAACGNKDNKAVATQVAAKVGSEEISVHQINQVLSRTNAAGVTPQQAEALRREVLEKLIDQQLAVDQATEAKLHRSPEVVAQIEAARREVLARAYIQQLASSLPKPTAEEVKKYYTEHPQLFAERRIFNLQEILVPISIGPVLAQELRAQVATIKSMDEVVAWLKSKDIKFGGGSATRPAEQIPLELLSKVHALKDGQVTIIDSQQGYTVLRVVSSQSAPIPEASALPRVEQFLANQRGAEAVAKTIKDLRAKTTIVYMGDFAQPAGAAAAIAPPATPPAPTPVPAPEAAAAGTKTAIEKGVAGLK